MQNAIYISIYFLVCTTTHGQQTHTPIIITVVPVSLDMKRNHRSHFHHHIPLIRSTPKHLPHHLRQSPFHLLTPPPCNQSPLHLLQGLTLNLFHGLLNLLPLRHLVQQFIRLCCPPFIIQILRSTHSLLNHSQLFFLPVYQNSQNALWTHSPSHLYSSLSAFPSYLTSSIYTSPHPFSFTRILIPITLSTTSSVTSFANSTILLSPYSLYPPPPPTAPLPFLSSFSTPPLAFSNSILSFFQFALLLICSIFYSISSSLPIVYIIIIIIYVSTTSETTSI